jgi:large subunit ribosomal protein L17
MRHQVGGRKLNRSTGQRRALRRNLLTELFRHERIRTTEARARAIRAEAEKLITIAKHGHEGRRDPVHARRLIAAVLTDAAIVKKLYDEVAPRFAERKGGYTRILKLGPREGDAAPMVFLELVE